jgi:hypothetical protein
MKIRCETRETSKEKKIASVAFDLKNLTKILGHGKSDARPERF